MEENMNTQVDPRLVKAAENNFYCLYSPNAGKIESYNLLSNLTRPETEFNEIFGAEYLEQDDGGLVQ